MKQQQQPSIILSPKNGHRRILILIMMIILGCALMMITKTEAFTVRSTTHTHMVHFHARNIIKNDATQRMNENTIRKIPFLHYAKYSDQDDDDDEDEEDIDLSDRDWRAFRAQLVMDSSSSSTVDKKDASSTATTTSSSSSTNNAEEIILEDNEHDDLDGIGSIFNNENTDSSTTTTPMSTQNFTPLRPSQWAYDSGHVIEQGAVILGGVEQDYGFGLRQQYFHKAAILVLEHGETFTKGIILNRPSDLILVDEKSNENHVEMRWRVWFGGDVQGLDALIPEVVCLHSMPSGNDKIDDVSKTVMKDIKWTTFEDAKMLVRDGHAKTIDFWVFAGYAGKSLFSFQTCCF